MPTLHLGISGLCFFAFDTPLKGGTKPKRADLLLQRLTRARGLAHVVDGRNEVLDQHFPLLEFNFDDWDKTSSTRAPSFLFSPDPNVPGRMKKGACVLFGDDMKILVDEEPLAGDLELSVHEPQTVDDLDTLWWMPTLDDAFPGQGAGIDPIHLTTPPAPNQEILARLPLAQGKLNTRKLSDDPSTFVHGSPTFKQRIAIELKFEVSFTRTVAIEMKRAGNPQADRLVFTPPAGANLKLELKNVEIDESIGIPRSYGSRAEADFEVYTQLLPPGSPARVNPAFLLKVGAGNSSGVGMSNCPPSAGTGN